MHNRRNVLVAGAALAAVSGAATAQVATVQPGPVDRFAAKARDTRRRLAFDGARFSGTGYAFLRDRAAASHFFLIGEEHGIAENPKLAAQLFADLAPTGYSRLGIEIAPAMATAIDRQLHSGGMPALRRFFADERTRVAFFGMAEEAAFLAAVRAAVPGAPPVLWGTDYDIAADRYLIGLLEAKRKPAAATSALAALKAASAQSWANYDRTRDFKYVFGFTGDADLVRAVRRAWPNPGAEADWILETLEESLAINALFGSGQGWASNERRAALLRKNLIRHLRAARRGGRLPKTMFKFGSNHLTRGLTSVRTFDMGTLLPEIAAWEGLSTFSMLVLPGAGRSIAQIDIKDFRYKPAPPKDGYTVGLDALYQAALPDAFTVFETAPLRPLAGSRTLPRELIETVHSYDAVVIMSGSTPSANL